MEGLIILFLLGIAVVVFILPIAALIKARRSERGVEQLNLRLYALERRLDRLQQPPAEPARTRAEAPVTPAIPIPSPQPVEPRPAAAAETKTLEALGTSDSATIPPKPQPPPPLLPPKSDSQPSATKPVKVTPPPQPEPAFSFEKVKGSLNWEQFMGAKLYAWIGGLALFLAAAYFVKYSFEKGWLPPEVRVAMGFALGLGLVAGGVIMRRKEYTITSHTLCATGVLVLYAVTFACRAVYHFAFFGPGPTFALMALITVAAFALAVRLEALPVAVLGMLGGFLTPILLSTGQDAPVMLFAYIALLDAGLIAVALHRRWFFLVPLAAAGTVIMQVGWAAKFFRAGRYFDENKIITPMAILLGFSALWLGATIWSRRRKETELATGASAGGLVLVAFLFAFYFQSFTSLAERPWLLLGFLFLLDAVALAISRADRRLAVIFPLAGAAVFAFLSVWMMTRVTNALLPAALAFTLIFALAHTALPLVFRHFGGETTAPPKWTLAFPPLALLVMLIPIFGLAELTVLIWPVVFLVNGLAVALAAATLSMLPVAAALLLTLLAAVGLLFKIPSNLTGLPILLIVIAACAIFFAAASVWLQGRLPKRGNGSSASEDDLSARFAGQIPTFAVALPFLLLVMMVGRLQLLNPSPVFGLALLLTGMLLALTKMFTLPWLPLTGLGCVAALEYAWHLRLFRPEAAAIPLVWYLVFLSVFSVYPFVRRNQFSNLTGPWDAAALAGPVQFFLVHQLVKAAWPNTMMGLLAAAFAIPPLASLALVLKSRAAAEPARQIQIALFGGVALFFITLIFPIQFSRQWITISWALEGAALCWLFHRVPHPGLRLTGVGLLIVSFVRLALNPAVLDYHARSGTPILNWYLYTYGIVTAALFVAARLLAPPRERVMGSNAPAILNSLGTILAFLLVNIQIADYFTAPGTAVLTFKFSGNFARDMTYSIAWALFALGLLVAGIARRLRPARYAALALLGVTMLKLFLHDLARLDALYRVGALVAVAIVALLASFLYQKYISIPDKMENERGTPSAPAS